MSFLLRNNVLSQLAHRLTTSLQSLNRQFSLSPFLSFTGGYTVDQQHFRGGAPKRYSRGKSPISGHPQMRGVVLKVLIKKPKKPNSANRKCVLLRLTNGKEVTAWIPGEGHNLQEHSQVLIEGGKKQDLIGVKVKVIRGKLDCAPVLKKTADI